MASRLHDWDEVARTLERELEGSHARPAEERAALWRTLGHVCWQRLQSTTRASRSYAAALEADPHDYEALRALEELLESMEDWRGAIELYESEIAVLGDADPERRRAVWMRVAHLASQGTHDPDRTLRALEEAAALAPLAPDQLRELAELQQQRGDLDAFCETFEGWCDDSESGAESADHVRLANLLEFEFEPDGEQKH